ncbi:MAG: hypothetical protein K0U93_14975, partial [Gammaproteobacteria bacterium]|nr:hypothetical protein [Gammaproteobacteria bacterium]
MSRNLFRSWLVLILCAFALTAHGEREPQLSAVSRASAYILAAPHGGYDLGTARIVREVCQAVTWSCLIAERFRTKSR